MSIEKELAMVRLSRVAYAGLLIFYPGDLRQRFGAEMTDVFQAVMRDAILQRGPAGMISLWRCALWELLTVAVPLRLASNAAIAGAISFFASSVLVLAFFRAVT